MGGDERVHERESGGCSTDSVTPVAVGPSGVSAAPEDSHADVEAHTGAEPHADAEVEAGEEEEGGGDGAGEAEGEKSDSSVDEDEDDVFDDEMPELPALPTVQPRPEMALARLSRVSVVRGRWGSSAGATSTSRGASLLPRQSLLVSPTARDRMRSSASLRISAVPRITSSVPTESQSSASSSSSGRDSTEDIASSLASMQLHTVSTSLEHLPAAVARTVLEFLPLTQLLQGTPAVSRAWRAMSTTVTALRCAASVLDPVRDEWCCAITGDDTLSLISSCSVVCDGAGVRAAGCTEVCRDDAMGVVPR
jgi:hypothetical protein